MRARICFSGVGGSLLQITEEAAACMVQSQMSMHLSMPNAAKVKQQHILCLHLNSFCLVTLVHRQIPKILSRRLVPAA